MTDIAYLSSQIEDLIAERPADLQKEISELIKDVSTEDIAKMSEAGMDPFGDEKITQIVLELKKGNPFDKGYIQAIDFSEEDEEFESIQKKVDEATNKSEVNFRHLLVEPLFMTDYPVHKHEMIGHFVLPYTMDMEEIEKTQNIGELCDSVTVSMISAMQEDLPSVPAGLNTGELSKYFKDHPSEFMNTLSEIEKLKGPSLSEFLDIIGPSLEERVAIDDPEKFPPRIASEFAEEPTNNQRRYRSLVTARKLSTQTRNLPQENYKDLQRTLDKFENTDIPVTYESFSEGMLQTGEIVSHEDLLFPEHKELYESLKRDGLIEPLAIDVDHPISRPRGLMILISTAPEARLDKFKEIRSQLIEPGDFEALYNFSKDSIADNLAESLREGGDVTIGDPHKRYSDQMEIPQGMRPDRNQNLKEVDRNA